MPNYTIRTTNLTQSQKDTIHLGASSKGLQVTSGPTTITIHDVNEEDIASMQAYMINQWGAKVRQSPQEEFNASLNELGKVYCVACAGYYLPHEH